MIVSVDCLCEFVEKVMLIDFVGVLDVSVKMFVFMEFL